MARLFDSRTTIFSPDGHLYQVEYAMMAVNDAGPCVAIAASDGIILAAEKKGAYQLLDITTGLSKIFRINDDLICAVAGISSDANVLVSEARQIAQRYLEQYGVPMSCERIVRWLADVKQAYTQFGGKRPFGVSILYAGWDEQYGYQVYKSDPSGDYSGWKACSIGSNNELAIGILNEEYEESCTLAESVKLAVKVLTKITKKTDLTEDAIEMVSVTRDGQTRIRTFTGEEKETLLKSCYTDVAAETSREMRMLASGEQNI